MIEEIYNGGTPVVLVDRVTDTLAENLDYVVEDNYQASYELTQYFINLGIKSFGIINGPMSASTGFQRAHGFRQALEDAGLAVNPVLEYYGVFSKEDGAKAVSKFHQYGMPEVIIAFNNLMAEGAILELFRRHYTIGEDLLFGSYGNVEVAQLLSGPFPYIEQDPKKMGSRIGEILINRLIEEQTGPFVYEFKQSLVVNGC